MFIEKLTIRDFNRFALSNINEFIYTPTERIQIILATNGGGKSSLLDELSPLPADLNKDFGDNGFEEIIIRHNNHRYVLTSGIKGKKHSFVKNGIELNQGGTRKIQLILVKEEFNYTQTIHDVVTGKKTFTHMSTPERKAWFSSIASVDYTYAIGVYNKLKSNLRDVTGTVRVMNTRLIELEKDIIGDDEVSRLSIVKQDMLVMIDDVLTNLVKVDKTEYDLNNLIALSDKLSKELTVDINMKTLTERKIEIETLVKTINKEISKLLEEQDELSKLKVDLVKSELEHDLKEKTKELDTINSSLYVDCNITALQLYLYKYSSTINELVNDIGSLSNDGANFNKLTLRTMERNHDKSNLEIERLKIVHGSLVSEYAALHELSKQDDTVCPNCTHAWKDKFNLVRYKQLAHLKDKASEEIMLLEKKSSTDKEVLVRGNEQVKLLARLDDILSLDIGKILLELKHKNKIPLTQVVNGLNVSISSWMKIERLQAEVNDLNSKIMLVDDANRKDYLDKSISISSKLDEYYSESANMKKEYLAITDNLARGKRISNMNDKLKDGLFSYSKYNKNKEIIELNKIKMYFVNELRKEIDIIDLKLNEVNIIKSKVEEHNSVLKQQRDRKEAITILMRTLSPTEGIIASSISKYLSNFTEHINFIIDQAWSYNMKVLPAKISEDIDLDYKFPVKIDRGGSNDVKETSTGMQDIINLAFKLMSMDKLGLSSFPLLLDEFGKTFDAKHRIKAYEVIDSFVTGKAEQIFMISHYESSYGRFKNAGIVVLSDSNLDLANDVSYNKDVKIR